MHLIGVLMLSGVGMGLAVGISAVLYATLPRSFLDYAELHGRFQGMRQEQLSTRGTPAEALPEVALGSQTA